MAPLALGKENVQRSANRRNDIYSMQFKKTVPKRRPLAPIDKSLKKVKERDRDIVEDPRTKRKYKLGRALGKGAFAVCFECYERSDNKVNRYALKRISKEKTSKDIRNFKKLESEVLIHSSLKHPNICKIYDHFQNKRYVFIVLELCDKNSIQGLLKSKTHLNLFKTSFIFKQIVEGLRFLHSKRIVHRDIKPGNVFLSSIDAYSVSNCDLDEVCEKEVDFFDTCVKIGDFGLAKKLSDSERCRSICGTPNYIAPEILSCKHTKKRYSFEVDIWALGVLLFAMVFKTPPFETKDRKLTFRRIKNCEYSFPEKPFELLKRDENLDFLYKKYETKSNFKKLKCLINEILVIEAKKRISIMSIWANSFLSLSDDFEDFVKSMKKQVKVEEKDKKIRVKEFKNIIVDNKPDTRLNTTCLVSSSLFAKTPTVPLKLKRTTEQLSTGKRKQNILKDLNKLTLSTVKERVKEKEEEKELVFDEVKDNYPNVWLTFYRETRKGLVYCFSGGFVGCLFEDNTQIVIHPNMENFQYIYSNNKKYKSFSFSSTLIPTKIKHKVSNMNDIKQKLTKANTQKIQKIKQASTLRYNRVQQQNIKAKIELSLQIQNIKQIQKYPHVTKYLFQKDCSVLKLNNMKYQVIFPDRVDLFILANQALLKFIDHQTDKVQILTTTKMKDKKYIKYYNKAKLAKQVIDKMKTL